MNLPNSIKHFKNRFSQAIIPLIIAIVSIANVFAQTEPVIKISQTGKGCLGDSLKINAGVGVAKIVWTRGTTTIKTKSNNPFLGYEITVAGEKNGNSKLKDWEVVEIQKLKGKQTLLKTAKMFNVGITIVRYHQNKKPKVEGEKTETD